MEKCLGNITYNSLLSVDPVTLHCSANKKIFKAIQSNNNRQSIDCFCRCLVSEQTYQWAKNTTGQWGRDLEDEKEILRQFTI